MAKIVFGPIRNAFHIVLPEKRGRILGRPVPTACALDLRPSWSTKSARLKVLNHLGCLGHGKEGPSSWRQEVSKDHAETASGWLPSMSGYKLCMFPFAVL